MSAIVIYWSRFSALMTSSGFCSLSRTGRSRISMYSMRSAGPRCCSLCCAQAGVIHRRLSRRKNANLWLVPVVIRIPRDTCREHDGQRRFVGLVRRRVVGFSWNEKHLVAWPQDDDLALVSLDVLERQLELTLSHPDRDLVHLVVVHPGRCAGLDLV